MVDREVPTYGDLVSCKMEASSWDCTNISHGVVEINPLIRQQAEKDMNNNSTNMTVTRSEYLAVTDTNGKEHGGSGGSSAGSRGQGN